MDEMKNNNEMERLYAETYQSIQVGALLHGRVIAVKSENVIVDVGYKSEGYVRSEEFSHEGLRALRPGDAIEVYVDPQVRDAEGLMRLSKDRFNTTEAVDQIKQLRHGLETIRNCRRRDDYPWIVALSRAQRLPQIPLFGFRRARRWADRRAGR